MVQDRPEADQNPSEEQRPSFEEALADLERIVRRLESGELGLQESLAEYEKGVRLIRTCHRLLADAEQRIQIVTGSDADGQPVLQTYREEDVSLDEKRETRSKRRDARTWTESRNHGEPRPG
ncbi:exodeoxyribonuclease VII small subunit [Thermopirellula anaerolimosa]